MNLRGPTVQTTRQKQLSCPELTHNIQNENAMARYGQAAGKSVESAMHRENCGTARSGKGGKGGKVTSRKQAIATGLSEAPKKGAKVPQKNSSQ